MLVIHHPASGLLSLDVDIFRKNKLVQKIHGSERTKTSIKTYLAR